jgi:GAF domain/Rieske [2Fe-2S] domain
MGTTVSIGPIDQIPPGEGRNFIIAQQEIAVFRTHAGEVFATQAYCPHRAACRWVRATIPKDEARRIASLRELRILDTEPDERFDRITRLATALFDVPIAMITLVDENRQWFKSCVGLSKTEDSRDTAFCAHVVYSREPMIVEDAFLDLRFADNPLVINEPRIRFYAGYPLILDTRSCIGTLCLIDTRPRTMREADLERLHDLANIAMQEIRSRADLFCSRPSVPAEKGIALEKRELHRSQPLR